MPVRPICSGGRPDSNGGVAQGLRDIYGLLATTAGTHYSRGMPEREGERERDRSHGEGDRAQTWKDKGEECDRGGVGYYHITVQMPH